jgi:RHS repeat-associated protein
LVGENLNVSRFILSDVIYDPYGVATVSGSVTPTFQYAGYYAHQESGLNLTWYRGYDPVIGRWQARDPLPNAERLEGLNLYEYVRGRTLGRIDPTGLIDWKVVIVCILGACSPDGPEDPPKPPSPPPSSQPACPKAGPTPKPSPTPLNPKTIPWWFAVPITVVGILSTS